MSLFARTNPMDSLAAFRDWQGFGEGTYTLNGDTYTETIESFVDPQCIGMSIDFTVKVEGEICGSIVKSVNIASGSKACPCSQIVVHWNHQK